MIVEGKAEGELNVNDVLNFKSEGNVNGKIFYGEIQIEEGGKLSGEINHRDKNNKQELMVLMENGLVFGSGITRMAKYVGSQMKVRVDRKSDV